MANSDTPALSYVGFRYSTSVPDAGWTAISDNGSGTPETTPTGVSLDTTASQIFRIEWDLGATSVRFYIDGVLVAEHSTKIPASGTLLGVAHILRELAGVVKAFRITIAKTRASIIA